MSPLTPSTSALQVSGYLSTAEGNILDLVADARALFSDVICTDARGSLH